MRNNYGDMKDLNNNGNKNVQLASFRILHVAELSDGGQAIVPFIVILLQTYAAWFAQSPESVVGLSDMITTGLSLNTIVTAQKTYLLYRNKVCVVHHVKTPLYAYLLLTFPTLSLSLPFSHFYQAYKCDLSNICNCHGEDYSGSIHGLCKH